MSSKIPIIRLNNGVEIPVFGLGTCQVVAAGQTEIGQAVNDAIEVGYRLFDCSSFLSNEKAIGDAIQKNINKGKVKREDLFLISKLWCDSHRPDLIEPTIVTTLNNLHTNYVDLYLIGGSMDLDKRKDLPASSPLKSEHVRNNVDYTEAWKAMEAVYKKKMTRGIGVYSFNSEQIDNILSICTVFPQVNKVEYHPLLNQQQLRKFCRKHGIVIISSSPFDAPKCTLKHEDINLLNDSRIKKIAERYEKMPAQILLKYSVQLGNLVTSSSLCRHRLTENIKIFDFYLAPEDMSYINSFLVAK